MKQFLLITIVCLLTGHLSAQDVGIGEEIVEPLRFPKFSLTGEYGLNRRFHGFADDSLRSDLDRRFESTLSFEAGLLKYFNAGGLFNIGVMSLHEPISIRMGLFAKPYIPLGERFSIFARVSAGIAVDLSFKPSAVEYYGSFDKSNFERVYRGQNYSGVPYGGFGGASIGIEVFPFSRFGFALEWGIRATLLHGSRKMPLVEDPKIKAGAPESFNFLLYEFPVMLTLHLII